MPYEGEEPYDDDEPVDRRPKCRPRIEEDEFEDEETRMTPWDPQEQIDLEAMIPIRKPVLERARPFPCGYIAAEADLEDDEVLSAETEAVEEAEDVEVEVAEPEVPILELADLVFAEDAPEPKKGSRRFFITLNNWTQAEYDAIYSFADERAEYGMIGKELCPTTGTPHIHVYLRFKNAMTFAVLRKKPGMARCDIKRCKGTEPQNRAYISKDGDFVEIHAEKATKQGQRKDLEEAADLLMKEGRVGLAKLVRDCPKLYVQHHSGFNALLDFKDEKRMLDLNPSWVWFYGKSGHGKSHACWETANKEARDRQCEIADISCASLTWCDGYRGEKVVIFNDLRECNGKGTKIPMHFWTTCIDKWPCRVEVKGSSINMQADSFYVTSVLHPSHFYAGDAREPNVQFLRRITRVVKCVKSVVDGEDVYSQIEMGNGLTPEPQADIGFNN